MISESLFTRLLGAEPVAQGSPKIVERRRARRPSRGSFQRPWDRIPAAMLRENRPPAARAALAHDSPRLADWRTALEASLRARRRATGWEPVPGELVAVGATFLFAWTRAARAAERREGSAAALKATKPDLDKLQRALGDALQAAGVVEEDSRITWWPAPVRRYADETGVEVLVRRVTPQVAERILETSGARP